MHNHNKPQPGTEMEEEKGPRMENGTRTREMIKSKSIKPKMQKKIKRGEIVLQSSPFAFVILATHR